MADLFKVVGQGVNVAFVNLRARGHVMVDGTVHFYNPHLLKVRPFPCRLLFV